MHSQIKGETMSSVFTYKVNATGQLIINRTTPVNTSVSLTDDKVSVTSGGFTPGVYRVTPYTVYREDIGVNHVAWSDQSPDGGGLYTATSRLTGNIGPYLGYRSVNILPSISSNFSNYPDRVIQKAYGKLGKSEAGLGETLGEIRETLNLLRHPFKGLRDFLYDANYRRLGLWNTLSHYAKTGLWKERGGRSLRGVDAAKIAADTWLEFRYGLMPLVYTVQDLVDLVNKKMQTLDPNRILTKRASIKVETPISFSLAPTFIAQLGDTELSCSVFGTDQMRFNASVQYRLSGLPSMFDLLGLSPKYLPETAWELTKLSFVVDWWFDVGAWLGALRFDPVYTVLGNTVGKRVSRRVSTNVFTSCAGISFAPKTNRGTVFSYQQEYYSREINRSLPSLPLFKPEFNSTKHAVDALALILQPILGKLRR